MPYRSLFKLNYSLGDLHFSSRFETHWEGRHEREERHTLLCNGMEIGSIVRYKTVGGNYEWNSWVKLNISFAGRAWKGETPHWIGSAWDGEFDNACFPGFQKIEKMAKFFVENDLIKEYPRI